MLKWGGNWNKRNGSWSAGKVVTREFLQPQETGLKCSRRGLYIP